MAGTSPLPVMSAIDEAAASLFDSMVPRLEAVLECTRVAAEQSRLRTLLLEQREMVSNRDSGGLAVGKPVYEGAGGVCALAPVTCSVAKAGGGRLAATRSASVSFSVLGLKGGAGMWSRERGESRAGARSPEPGAQSPEPRAVIPFFHSPQASTRLGSCPARQRSCSATWCTPTADPTRPSSPRRSSAACAPGR